MQRETAGWEFLEFGCVYKQMDPELQQKLICQTKRVSTQHSYSQFWHFDCDTYLEVQSGVGILLVSRDPGKEPVQEFAMNKRIRINPHVSYAVVPTTPELMYNLYVEPNYSLDVMVLDTPYEFRPVLPRIHIPNILGYYYRIRTPGYSFKGEKHKFFELTYVDTGTLYTVVDGVSHTLPERSMIIYGPDQFHTQFTDDTQPVSYVTILFNMENLTRGIADNWYEILTNKVFPYNKKIYMLIKSLVQESGTGTPYRDTLMHCLLTETIVRLLQDEYSVPQTQHPGVARQNYQDELFDRIVEYVESRICEPITIAEICQQFSLSRSTLQLLFKNAVNQSPKKYISDMKLEKSRQMLRENKYTVSEIAFKLGYSSIHYFSNAFNQKYHVSPSEYAKRIY